MKLSDIIQFVPKSELNSEHLNVLFGISDEREAEISKFLSEKVTVTDTLDNHYDALQMFVTVKDKEFTPNEIAYILYRHGFLIGQDV